MSLLRVCSRDWRHSPGSRLKVLASTRRPSTGCSHSRWPVSSKVARRAQERDGEAWVTWGNINVPRLQWIVQWCAKMLLRNGE